MECAIAHLSHLQHFRREIIHQGSRAAVDFEPIALRKRINAAELQHTFCAILETAQDGEQIGNDHVVAFADWLNDFPAREHTGDMPEPPLQDFYVNSQRERVKSTDLDFLSPVRRPFEIQKIAVETLQSYMMGTANVIFS